ncbi:hypothetical protein L3D22_12460 [Lysobacter soli]|uniref:hypothetical protein n=1 Tax=Lysobacter soli TaxID=453783 RepID=UPI00209FE758|nr:hypothetical protein [Lysobacter soli]UTA53184.1 hypothetical protein L3D22_12460 [Lysobacter soli]
MPAPLNSQREDQRDAAARLAQALAQLAELRDALSWHRQKSRQLTDQSSRLVSASQLLRGKIEESWRRLAE